MAVLVTLLTSPVFAFILALLIGSGFLIFYIVSGKAIPHIRGKHKDTEFELSPPEATPAPLLPSTAEAGSPPSTDEPAPPTDPTFAIYIKLLEKRSEGLWALTSEWSKLRPEIEKLTDPDREHLEVVYRELRIALGDTTAFDELAQLSRDNTLWRRPTMALANHYFQVGDLHKAREWAVESIGRALAKREHSQSFALNVKIEAQLNPEGVDHLCREYIRIAQSAETKSAVLVAAADLSIAAKDYERAAVLFQAALDLQPESIDTRFSSAFAVSDSAEHRLFSYAHYRRLEKTSPNRSFVLNNLAAVCDDLNDASLYGFYLERAVEVDKAWATVNIANKLSEIGFLDLAEKKIGELDESERESERAVSTRENFARIKKRRLEQQAKLDKRSNQYVAFFSILASDFLANAAERSPTGAWQVGADTLTLSSLDGIVSARLQRGSQSFSGTLQKVRRHYGGRIKDQQASYIGQRAYQVRLLLTSSAAHLLLEELNYSETKTEDAEFLSLPATTGAH